LPPAKAGVRSALNDTTREPGAIFGVAVRGNITSSAYLRAMHGSNLGIARARPLLCANRPPATQRSASTSAPDFIGPRGEIQAVTGASREEVISFSSAGMYLNVVAGARATESYRPPPSR
jgi:hypothetical protein